MQTDIACQCISNSELLIFAGNEVGRCSRHCWNGKSRNKFADCGCTSARSGHSGHLQICKLVTSFSSFSLLLAWIPPLGGHQSRLPFLCIHSTHSLAWEGGQLSLLPPTLPQLGNCTWEFIWWVPPPPPQWLGCICQTLPLFIWFSACGHWTAFLWQVDDHVMANAFLTPFWCEQYHSSLSSLRHSSQLSN